MAPTGSKHSHWDSADLIWTRGLLGNIGPSPRLEVLGSFAPGKLNLTATWMCSWPPRAGYNTPVGRGQVWTVLSS